MPTRSAVMVDLDMYELTKVRAMELNSSFSQVAVNALEKHYGLPLSDQQRRMFHPGSGNGHKPHRKIRPNIRRNMRARTLRKIKSETQQALELANKRIEGYENDLLHAKSNYQAAIVNLNRTESENERLRGVIQNQVKDIQYFSNQTKTLEAEIKNTENTKWHLQGVIEGLQFTITRLLDDRKG